MNGHHEFARHQCRRAEQALLDVDLDTAIAVSMQAKSIVGDTPDPESAALFARAAIAEVDGLALSDELQLAQEVATTAFVWSDYCGAGTPWVPLAYMRLHEVYEMQRLYRRAARGFDGLYRVLPDEPWAAGIKLRCANHMISIGVHNADPFLAAEGIKRGERVRPSVADTDEVAAWLQWRGLHESRRAQPERAARTFEESFALRARNRRRDITRRFLEAEMAFAVSQDSGIAALDLAVAAARDAGLRRHARAAADHMGRLVA